MTSMIKAMRHVGILGVMAFLAVLAALGASGAAPAHAAAMTFTENVKVPVSIWAYVPCAAGGAGEVVVLNGTLHMVFQNVIDANGGYHSKYHFQPQGVSGAGLVTGDQYLGTGVTQGTFSGTTGLRFTDVNNFRVIGKGQASNYSVHYTYHVTVNANGTLTAVVSNFKVRCK